MVDVMADIDTLTDPWTTGTFSLVDFTVDWDDAVADIVEPLTTTVDSAESALDAARQTLIQEQAELALVQKKQDHVEKVYGEQVEYEVAKGLYDAAKLAHDAYVEALIKPARGAVDLAQSAVNGAKSTYDAAIAATQTAYNAMLATEFYVFGAGPLYDPIKAAEYGIAEVAEEGAKVAYDAAKGSLTLAEGALSDLENGTVYQGLKNALNEADTNLGTASSELNAAKQAMYNDGFFIGKAAFTLDEVAAIGLEYLAAETEKIAAEANVGLAEAGVVLAAEALAATQSLLDPVDFKLTVVADAEIYAQAGLQLEFLLDGGSVDADVDYTLTTSASFNKTTDVLQILPSFLNQTTGEAIAFSTVSPNVQVFAGIYYDMGATIDLFLDAYASLHGNTIFDLSPNSNGLQIPLELHTEGLVPLVDFDSTDGVEYTLSQFKEDFAEGLGLDVILDELEDWGLQEVSVAFPTVETIGTETFDATAEPPLDLSAFTEAGLIGLDLTELSDAFFNLVKAEIELGDEFKAILNDKGLAFDANGGLDNFVPLLKDAIDVILEAVFLAGDTDGDGYIPVFVLDATDETTKSLLHLNTIDGQLEFGNLEHTGKFGFYSAYGESEDVFRVEVDVDQLIAAIVNYAVGNASGEIINPLDLEIGLDTLFDLAKISGEVADTIQKYINFEFSFEAADFDFGAGINFSQEFTLSVDDFLFSITLENGTTFDLDMDNPDGLRLTNASSYDQNGDGVIEYDMLINPIAMFSNDTELGLGIDYTLDLLKSSLSAGLNLSFSEIFEDVAGLATLLAGADLEIPALELGLGPALRIQGDLDLLTLDVFESRFALNLSSETVSHSVG